MADSKHLQHKRVERVAHSSAVSSVAYTRPGDGKIATTKSGAYIYDGDPSKFYDWEFRTRLKVKKAGSDFEKYAGVMSEVVEGLQGDAFIVAKEMGTEVFCHPGTKVIEIGWDHGPINMVDMFWSLSRALGFSYRLLLADGTKDSPLSLDPDLVVTELEAWGL